MIVVNKYYDIIDQMWENKIPYTSMAITAHENNTSKLKDLHNEKINHNVKIDIVTVHEVVNKKLNIRRCVIDENNYTQCTCSYFQQYGTLCPHIMKSYIYLKHLSQVSAMTFQKWSQNIVPH